MVKIFIDIWEKHEKAHWVLWIDSYIVYFFISEKFLVEFA